jgi:hypothetical protein
MLLALPSLGESNPCFNFERAAPRGGGDDLELVIGGCGPAMGA